MKDKICMVTGANAGIGKVTALELARWGATVVMVARSRERGDAALAEVRADSDNEHVSLMVADLSIQAEVRRLAAEFQERYERLDVLVNNAGAFFIRRQESADGLEMTFALNHLAYFLLTNLLLDRLKASAPARIVNVASAAHRNEALNFDDLQATKAYNGRQVYGQSKLANIMFTYELAARLQGSGVTVNALHPGFVGTNFATNNGWLPRMAMRLMRPFILSPEEGAATSIYLATAPEVAEVSGKYFDKKKAISSNSASYDREAARRLWAISEELTGL